MNCMKSTAAPVSFLNLCGRNIKRDVISSHCGGIALQAALSMGGKHCLHFAMEIGTLHTSVASLKYLYLNFKRLSLVLNCCLPVAF